MIEMAIVFCITFMIFCLAFSALHSYYVGRISLLDWSILGMGGVYGLGGALVMYATTSGQNPLWEEWLLPYQDLYMLHTLSAYILLGSIWFGWISFHRSSRKPYVEIPVLRTNSKLFLIMWMLLITAIGAQWIYAQAYGGFLNLLDYSALIRLGNSPITNEFSFLKPLGGFGFLASFGFYGLWLSGYRRRGSAFGAILSVLFSLYVAYSWLGRITFLVYMATFILGTMLFKHIRPRYMLINGIAIVLFIAIGSYIVSVFLNLKPADSLLVFLARELSFPFVSFFSELNSGEHLFRSFKDLLMAPAFLLPSSWWMQWIESAGQINTTIVMGAPKGEQGVTGSIPIDLLTLGYMQAHIFGLVLIGVIFGILLRFVQTLLDRISNQGVQAMLSAYVILKLAIIGVFYSAPEFIVSGNFDLIVTAIILGLMHKYSLPKRTNGSPYPPRL